MPRMPKRIVIACGFRNTHFIWHTRHAASLQILNRFVFHIVVQKNALIERRIIEDFPFQGIEMAASILCGKILVDCIGMA